MYAVPAVSVVVGEPEITPVLLFRERPSGSEGAHTSTTVCPLNSGVRVRPTPRVAMTEVVP